MILITHWDVDGIFCVYLFYKKFGNNFKVIFSGPRAINKTLAKLIYEGKNDEVLYITDIAPNQVAIYLSACFKEAYWIDHHINNEFYIPPKVTLYIKSYKSAARCVAEYFDISDEYLELVDAIDSNDIKSQLERDLRDLIVAIRFFNSKTYSIYFINIAREMYEGAKIADIIGRRRELLRRFREYLRKKEDNIILSTRILEVLGRKVFIVDLEDNIPSFNVIEVLQRKIGEQMDYIIILYKGRGEIRTTTGKNVLKIAKCLGGGGHLYAAGFQFLNKDAILTKIKECLIKSIKDEDKLIG